MEYWNMSSSNGPGQGNHSIKLSPLQVIPTGCWRELGTAVSGHVYKENREKNKSRRQWNAKCELSPPLLKLVKLWWCGGSSLPFPFIPSWPLGMLRVFLLLPWCLLLSLCRNDEFFFLSDPEHFIETPYPWGPSLAAPPAPPVTGRLWAESF